MTKITFYRTDADACIGSGDNVFVFTYDMEPTSKIENPNCKLILIF